MVIQKTIDAPCHLMYNKIQFYINLKAMKEESTLAGFSAEMPGRGCKPGGITAGRSSLWSWRLNIRSLIDRSVGLDGIFHRYMEGGIWPAIRCAGRD